MIQWLKSKLSGQKPPANINTAAKYFRQGKFEKALVCANEILKLKPGVAMSWRFKGECLGELERFPDAERCLRRALELGGPGTEDIPNLIAVMQFCSGKKDEAIRALMDVMASSASEEVKSQAAEMVEKFEKN